MFRGLVWVPRSGVDADRDQAEREAWELQPAELLDPFAEPEGERARHLVRPHLTLPQGSQDAGPGAGVAVDLLRQLRLPALTCAQKENNRQIAARREFQALADQPINDDAAARKCDVVRQRPAHPWSTKRNE